MNEAVQPPHRAMLLRNPGARRADEALGEVVARLRAGGLDVEDELVGDFEHLEDFLKSHQPSPDIAVVCGGDGSLCRAAPGVLACGLTLGILPMGTANDLARTLGIPADLEGAADIILAGHSRTIDVGSVNGRPFFNVASIGLSVALARELSPDLKRRWGKLGYAIAAFRALAKAHRFAAIIRENGAETRVKTLQIAVGNGRFYGGGTVVAAHAEIDDGHLDLYSLELTEVWRLALMLPHFRAGEHGTWAEVRTARGTEFEIATRTPMPINADGELLAETPAVFKVHPNALRVLCPAAIAE